MAKFVVMEGTHFVHERKDKDGNITTPYREYKKGETVESDTPLDTMYVNKFRRLDDVAAPAAQAGSNLPGFDVTEMHDKDGKYKTGICQLPGEPVKYVLFDIKTGEVQPGDPMTRAKMLVTLEDRYTAAQGTPA